jgi:hypothetical protein
LTTLNLYPAELKEDLAEVKSEQAAIKRMLESILMNLPRDPANAPKQRFYHAKEAAAMFGVSKGTWFNWRTRGIVSEGKTVGYNQRVWPAEEVLALYEKIKAGGLEA